MRTHGGGEVGWGRGEGVREMLLDPAQMRISLAVIHYSTHRAGSGI
jgi:hypothetical protein